MLREILHILKGLAEHIRDVERLDTHENQQSEINVVARFDILQPKQDIVKNKKKKYQYTKQCIGAASLPVPQRFQQNVDTHNSHNKNRQEHDIQ